MIRSFQKVSIKSLLFIPLLTSTMPPRILLRSLRTIRRPLLPSRRTLATTSTSSFPASKLSLRIPIITTSTILGVGIGLYSLSKISNAETTTQSSKTASGSENRELAVGASRKQGEKSGKAEKQGNRAGGGSSRDNKPGHETNAKKPESGANEESKTGKVKGGHDEKGQPKDETVKNKSGKTTEGKTDETQKGDEHQNEENGDEEQGGAIGKSPLLIMEWGVLIT